MNDFSEKVREIVRQIPKGEVRTYSEVAGLAGSARAYRAVANIMAANFDINVPCHRVICSNGEVGGYNRGGASAKKALLIAEGYTFKIGHN